MKIDNSRIFTADIYQVLNSRSEVMMLGDVSFGSYGYDDMLVDKNVVVIHFEKMNCYVPIWNLKTVADYASVRFNSSYQDERTLREDPGFMPSNGKHFVKNIKRLINVPGRTSIDDIIKMQASMTASLQTQLPENSSDDNNNIEM